MGKPAQSKRSKTNSPPPPPTSPPTSSSSYGVAFCSLIIALASILIKIRDNSPINEYLSKDVASTKPYNTFEEFYPYYLHEHSLKITRQFHYVGTTLFLIYLLLNPRIIFPIFAGGLTAYSVIPFFRHLSSGIGEVIAFMVVYLIGARLITRSLKRMLIPLVLGYSFAWIGHFVFEENKPATFVYPIFSLFGDFRMMYDAIRTQTF